MLSGYTSLDRPLTSNNYYESPVTDSTLRKYNIGACILHTLQGTMLLAASQAVARIKDKETNPITTAFLAFNQTSKKLVPGSQPVGHIELAVVAAVFLLMSAVAHGWVIMYWETYLSDIRQERNR